VPGGHIHYFSGLFDADSHESWELGYFTRGHCLELTGSHSMGLFDADYLSEPDYFVYLHGYPIQ
jgi:hypothetical protein